jgi:hypothetical protein
MAPLLEPFARVPLGGARTGLAKVAALDEMLLQLWEVPVEDVLEVGEVQWQMLHLTRIVKICVLGCLMHSSLKSMSSFLALEEERQDAIQRPACTMHLADSGRSRR